MTRCFPLEDPPTTRGRGAASEVACSTPKGTTRHASASRAVDEGSGLSCHCHVAAHSVAHARCGGAHDGEESVERIDEGGNRRVWRGTALDEAGSRCGSRPLTAAHGTETIGRSVRPACDAWILWQAHKARNGVDTIAASDVKQRARFVADVDFRKGRVSADWDWRRRWRDEPPGLTARCCLL